MARRRRNIGGGGANMPCPGGYGYCSWALGPNYVKRASHLPLETHPHCVPYGMEEQYCWIPPRQRKGAMGNGSQYAGGGSIPYDFDYNGQYSSGVNPYLRGGRIRR